MISIDKWFKKNSIINEPKKVKIFKKYFYLNWISNKDYSIHWLNEKPAKYNFIKEVKLRGYGETIVFIGNINYLPNKIACSY